MNRVFGFGTSRELPYSLAAACHGAGRNTHACRCITTASGIGVHRGTGANMPRPPLLTAEAIRKLKAPKRSKYGVRTDAIGKLTRTLDGRVYHSKAERNYAAELELLRKCGKIRSWEPQAAFLLTVNEKPIGYHYVDFRVVNLDGSVEVHEVKGAVTDLWRWKRAHFEAQHPEIPYKVIGV